MDDLVASQGDFFDADERAAATGIKAGPRWQWLLLVLAEACKHYEEIDF